jgi:uncharacterized protein
MTLPCTAQAARPVLPVDVSAYVEDTVRWLEEAVIGLNLCPFTKGVHAKGQIHYVVAMTSEATNVLGVLRDELAALASFAAQDRDTTLIILPCGFQDFLEFNDFLGDADALVQEMELEGVLQIASFHPQFQFAGTDVNDVTNCTNRSPYPTLHLLREESIDRAVQAFPGAEAIFEKNMEVLEALGAQGWADLGVGPRHQVDGSSIPAAATGRAAP